MEREIERYREVFVYAENKILKPCPFCGGKGKIGRYRTYVDMVGIITKYYVECPECGITQPTGFMSDEEAIQRWNRRSYE